MREPSVTTKVLDNLAVLYTDEYINGLVGEKLEEQCCKVIEKGLNRIIINFRQTELINSIAISILIGVIERIMESRGVLCFSNLTKINKEIFEMLGLTRYVRIFETEEEAINQMSILPLEDRGEEGIMEEDNGKQERTGV